MFIRYSLLVTNALGSPGGSLRVNWGGPHKIEVDATSDSQLEGAVLFTATAKFEPSQKNREVFRSLQMDQLPVHSADISTPDGTIRAGETLDGLVPPLSVLPEHFRSLVYMVSKELHFAARETYELLRWTGSSYGSNRTLGSRPQQWSLTGQEWSFLPFEYSAHLRAEGGLPLQPPFEGQVQEVLNAGGREPLAYDLLAEAIQMRDLNPRSALVIGLTALEVGVKEFISQLVPESKWLVEHLPSPPIERILREYLPTLPVRMKLPGHRVASPPEKLLSRLKNAIGKRNDLIHVGVETVEFDFLEEVLDDVDQVLRLLDYYGGHEWALRYLSVETKQALGLDGA